MALICEKTNDEADDYVMDGSAMRRGRQEDVWLLWLGAGAVAGSFEPGLPEEPTWQRLGVRVPTPKPEVE